MIQFSVNLFMGLTNIPGLFVGHPLVFLAAITSALMHFSEKKHNLPGLWPLNCYAEQFLWVDRVVSTITILIFLPQILNDVYLIKLGIFGLVCMGLSEGVEGGPHWFIFFHTIWHFTTYYVTYLLVNIPPLT
jgi:hypothetical protein